LIFYSTLLSKLVYTLFQFSRGNLLGPVDDLAHKVYCFDVATVLVILFTFTVTFFTLSFCIFLISFPNNQRLFSHLCNPVHPLLYIVVGVKNAESCA
jgi:hypothetical protein